MYSWPCMLKVAPCMVGHTAVRSYIQIFSAWWDTTILYNYGAILCELRYELYNVSLENLVLDQLIIPYLTFSLILIKSLLDISMTLWGKILSWSLIRVEGTTVSPGISKLPNPFECPTPKTSSNGQNCMPWTVQEGNIWDM